MGKIHKLPAEIVNQIAAGEVVERPVSVVKELVDNALDSGATEIIVEIINGGEQLIKIIDNGSGILAEDLALTVQPHATSKLKNLDDLLNIQTMGFRGEALASIASVSRFKLSSRHEDEELGLQIFFNNENKLEEKKIVINHGTTVEIADLFYNVPARKKFLKKATTEFNHIMTMMLRFALIYPKISWKLINNEKESFYYPAVDSWQERVSQVLGTDVKEDFLSLNLDSEKVKVSGFVSAPNKWQTNRKHQYIFVNKRPISSALINRALLDGIGHLLPPRFYPYYILHLEVPGDLVDVNVHPRKSEVKFADEHAIFSAVRHAVNTVMNQSKLIQESQNKNLNFNIPQKVVSSSFSFSTGKSSSGGKGLSHPQSGLGLKFNAAKSQNLYQPLNIQENNLAVEDSGNQEMRKINLDNETEWTVIGQIDKRFIVLEMKNGILLFDQHALAEGILYKKLKRTFEENKSLTKQSLLIPANLEFTAWQIALLEEFSEVLIELGFEIEAFGGNTYVVQAVPADVSGVDPQELVNGLLNDLAMEDKGINLEAKRDRVIKYTACRSAIKFGDELSFLEMENLMKDFFDLGVHTCAHGRPVYWEIPYGELLKKFQR